MTLSDFVKDSVTCSIARSRCDSWASCHLQWCSVETWSCLVSAAKL